jgi:hypothetical protein
MSETQEDCWFSHPQFATRLDARVVDESGSDARIHGYEVTGDLSRHFSFSDVLLLSLTGEEPDEHKSKAFGRALIALTPISVASAPCHVGALAHLVSRSYASSIAAASIVLAEHASTCVKERRCLLDYLRGSDGAYPNRLRVPDAPACHADLLALLVSHSDVARQPWFGELDRLSALLAVFHECGLHQDWQLESALFTAWCPCMMAEIGTRGADPLESYPINVPRFKYVAG